MKKLLLEFGPIIIFFATYKNSDITFATLLMVGATIVSLAISYMLDGKISMMLLISGIILIILGAISIFTRNFKFIKMKPTIAYLIFCGILMFSMYSKKLILKDTLGSLIEMNDDNWIILSKRFAGYFMFMAIINEVVWRNYSEEFWVNFKVFGAVPITLLFVIIQIPFFIKNSKLIKGNDN